MARAKTPSFRPLRGAILLVLLGLAYAAGLGIYKKSMMEDLGRKGVRSLAEEHPAVLSLFQASFYFYYEEQFLPGIRKTLAAVPGLDRIRVVSKAGSVLFDSSALPTKPQDTQSPPELLAGLSATSPRISINGFSAQVAMPADQLAIVYSFDGSGVRNRLALALGVGLLIALFLFMLTVRLQNRKSDKVKTEPRSWRAGWLGLRGKFLITIVLINLITSAIIFFTLTALQTREETLRIRKESVLFARFSTAQVISDFSSFFYFYYADKFIPGVKTIISTNQNLVGVKIISRRTSTVLFDSETALAAPQTATPSESTTRVELPPGILDELRVSDFAVRRLSRGGRDLLSVVNTYRNENREALFLVEYLFTFDSLRRSVSAIRQQILLDLVPSLAIGLLIAAIFAQFLIIPIRRLVAALKLVSAGDYEVSVDTPARDEIGELVMAFNGMTDELRKKAELRKYLSDSTYRQVMESPDAPGGPRMAGSRVEATILFSDIRNFVAYCESLDAEEVTAMLNEYFSEMVEVVYKHKGEVDKFIGDALLAVFYRGPGESASSTSLRSLYCALEMRERLKEFNARRVALGKAGIEIGVGVTHGEIISGPIGSNDRRDFTVIGDVVNLANRIEKLSKLGSHTKIVFSQHVEVGIRGLLEYVKLEHEPIRGKEEDIAVFELVKVRNLEILIENATTKGSPLRLESIELLGNTRNSGAIPTLIACLNDDEERVRQLGAVALSRVGSRTDENALNALLKKTATEKSEKVLGTLVAAIGRLCSDERILELAPYLDHPNDRVVANVVEAIGQARLLKGADLILPKLASRNNRVKANAAMALFAAGHTSVLDTLKPMLMYSDPLMRSSAAFAIGELSLLAQKNRLVEGMKAGDRTVKVFLAELQECVPMLVSLLRDPDPMVKRQSIIALGKIKDKSSILPIIDTIDFSKDTRETLQDVSTALQSIGSHRLVREVLAQLS